MLSLKSKWVLGLPFLMALLFYNYAFNRSYFMLVEGRAYIAQAIHRIDNGEILNWLRSIDLHTYVTQRITNQSFYLVTSSICGIGMGCQNFLQILLIAFTALLIAIFADQLKIARVYCVFLALLWVFSHGVLHAVSWQATGLEKLLGFFVMLYLVAFHYCGEKPATKLNLILSNLILGFILLAALSSKEHSALLFPISVLLAIAKVYQGEWRLKEILKKNILPSVIAIFHAALFFKFIAMPLLLPKTAGVYDGNVTSNLLMFMGFAFNSYENYDFYNPLVSYGIWGSFLVLIALQICDFVRTNAKMQKDFLNMLWAGGSSLGFLVVMSKLHYQNRYYLLVPDLFLLPLLFFVLKLWVSWGARLIGQVFNVKKNNLIKYANAAFAILIFTYGSWHGVAFWNFYRDHYEPFAEQNRNFISEQNWVQQIIPEPLTKKLYFISEVHGKIASVIHSEFPPEAPRYVGAYWFQQREYINGHQTEWVKFVDLKDFTSSFAREEESYYITFNRDLMVQRIEKGSSVLFEEKKEIK